MLLILSKLKKIPSIILACVNEGLVELRGKREKKTVISNMRLFITTFSAYIFSIFKSLLFIENNEKIVIRLHD